MRATGENPKHSKEILSHCHSAHHKSHKDWPGIESGHRPGHGPSCLFGAGMIAWTHLDSVSALDFRVKQKLSLWEWSYGPRRNLGTRLK
jgi:hypothetical protein